MKKNSLLHIIAGLVLLASCKPEVNIPAPSKGSADFTRYISLGDTYTAGFADNGLYLDGQKASYANLIGQQIKAVGGGSFTSPLFSDAQASGSGYLRLSALTNGIPTTATVAPTAVRGQVSIPGIGNVVLFTKYSGELENYGVPALKLLQITSPVIGNANGFYERLLPGNAGTNTTAYLDFATTKPFTFFSNWLGCFDVLGYVTAGGAGAANQLTPKATFSALYNASVGKLTSGGQKGVLATIPDFTNSAFLNTVTVDAIVGAAKQQNPNVVGLFINASNDAGVYAPRLATAKDLILLTFDRTKLGVNGYGFSPLNPVENQFVLDAAEVNTVKDFTNSYNNAITSAAALKGLAVFDGYAFFNQLKSGITVEGVAANAAFITGSVYSLDGIHLTPRGNAIVANGFIDAINKKYGSNVPLVNTSAYNGVKFP